MVQKMIFVLVLLGCAGFAFAAKPSVAPIACTEQESITPFASAVLAEINRARESPRQYADTVKRVFRNMDVNGVYARGNRRVATVEGRAAVDEAVHFLANADPVAPLQMASCLNLAAARHAKAKGSTGSYGHFGVTGRDPSERASFLSTSPVGCAENIAYGYDDITELVSAIIVDDAVEGRGHRNNLFDPRMKSFGAGRAPHLLRKTIDVHLFCLDDISG